MQLLTSVVRFAPTEFFSKRAWKDTELTTSLIHSTEQETEYYDLLAMESQL